MDDLEAGKLTECCEMLNSITNQAENKKCFDCVDNYSPRYLCTTFSTFVCSCCASVHQELGHKIKVLSVFGFTENEIKRLKATGNKAATSKWLARWKPELYSEPDPTSPTYKDDARKYMNVKYVEKRWVKLPPPLPIKKDPAATRDGADISPRDADASPRSNSDISPRSDTDVSPRTTDVPPFSNDDAIPRSTGAPLSCSGGIPKTNSSIEKPRSLSSSGGVSSRKSMEVPKGWDAVMSEEVPVKQRDGEKPKNPFLDDDEPFPATPVRYSYMAHTPQMFIHPVSFPPGQYGYPQYPVPLDLNGFTPYYPHPSPHQFQTPLYSYPYDPHSHMHPLPPAHDSVSWVSGKPSAMHDFTHECTHQQDSLAWATKPQDNTVWASARPAERMLTQQYSCRDLPRAYEGMPKPPVLRSVSDNSLAASMRQAFGEDLPSSCTKCTHSQLNVCKVDHNTSETQQTINKSDENISKQEPTVSKTEQSKQKLQGIMTKMTGLLKKAQNT